MVEKDANQTSIAQSAEEIETVNKSQQEEAEGDASMSQSGVGDGDDQSAANEMANNHDLIGIDGILRAQKTEIEKKKVS